VNPETQPVVSNNFLGSEPSALAIQTSYLSPVRVKDTISLCPSGEKAKPSIAGSYGRLAHFCGSAIGVYSPQKFPDSRLAL